MTVATIFGSNQGDKYRILQAAVTTLSAAVGKVVRESSFYETAPWGFVCEECFLNQVVVFDTLLSPERFLYHCQETEKKLGRQRNLDGPRYSSRPIDIDLLFYGSQIVHTPDLVIPHPRIAERNFVLTPLAEIMPDFVHPVFRKTISELLALCPDKLAVKRLD